MKDKRRGTAVTERSTKHIRRKPFEADITAVAFGIVVTLFSLMGAAVAEQGLRYLCQPAVPVFCGNIHIACANPTRIATERMVIEIRTSDALIWFGERASPVRARVTRDDAIVIRPVDSKDWIRIRPDGHFAQRIYRKRLTAMAYGVCEPQAGAPASNHQ